MTAPAPILTHIVAPAAWASYLINGDASGLEPGEREKADAWLQREGVEIVGTEPNAEPYFSNGGRLLVPELDCSGFTALDYRAREIRLEAEGEADDARDAAAHALPYDESGPC